jgi:hypothetical protein
MSTSSFAARAIGSTLFLVLLAGLSQGLQAAEKKKIVYTTKSAPAASRTVISPGDHPEHRLIQQEQTNMTTSDEPDWNAAPVTVYSNSDVTAGNGNTSGYATRLHKNGDQTFYKFQGTAKSSGAGQGTGEGKVELIGGTGKFKNAKGTGTYSSKTSDGSTVTTVTMEVEY